MPNSQRISRIPKNARSYGHAGPPNRQSSEAVAKYVIVDLFAKVAQGSDTPEDAVAWAERELKLIYERG